MRETDILVRMCEECVRKLKGRPFRGSSREEFLDVQYYASEMCKREATFVVYLRLPERKVRE